MACLLDNINVGLADEVANARERGPPQSPNPMIFGSMIW
jgi:hypothetical protein